MAKAHRKHKGAEYCGTCYASQFTSIPCNLCGKSARVHCRDTTEPICGVCQRANRRCVRCHRPVPRASRVTALGAICPSCVKYDLQRRPCELCGNSSRELGTLIIEGSSMICCRRCRQAQSHGTCSRCRRHRVIALREGSRRWCWSCVPESELSHDCPDCGRQLPGNGAGRCRACLLKAQVDHEASLLSATLEREWVRQCVAGYAQWLLARQPDNLRLAASLRSDLPLFQMLDQQLETAQALSGEALLALMPQNRLRRHLLATVYLQDSGLIHLERQQKREAADRGRMKAKLAECADTPWAYAVQGYADELTASHRQVHTSRLYLAVAIRFCRDQRLEGPFGQAELVDFLTRNPGSRASLSAWVTYVRRSLGYKVTMPPRIRTPLASVRAASKTLALLLAASPTSENTPTERLEAILCTAFGYSTRQLRKDVECVGNEGAWLRTTNGLVDVPVRLRKLALEWAQRRGIESFE